MIELGLGSGGDLLRPWRSTDRGELVAQANHRSVWRNLTDRFPHPYTLRDAVEWIGRVEDQIPPQHFAVIVGGRVAGGAGVVPISQYGGRAAEVGYWLGPEHWGRGLASAVVETLVPYAFGVLGMQRVQAGVFGWNGASARVLEKNGFLLEGRLREAVYKDGATTDLLLYGLVFDDYGSHHVPQHPQAEG
jgi:RimJ/RimL family protein N-acetyltransferase